MPLLEAPLVYLGGPHSLRSVSETDRLWLLRAVQSEGCDRRLVAQTLLNRWAFLGESGDGRGLAAMVRAYCSPLHDPKGLASQRTIFDPETVDAVASALEGPAGSFPAGVVHFAAVNHVPHGSKQVLVWSDGKCNSLYRVPASVGFRYRSHPARDARVSPWVWLTTAGFIAWQLLKR